ncbi:MAG: alpha/beta fold hydrolase [Cyclobacteriaceae bacterium]|nr:alpha/beta fold hydrolase [Cyclobacteriaceae bacterium]
MNLYHNTIGEGEPLVILHGLFGSSDNWVSIARKFAKNYRVILVDLRNHGRSPHHQDWNYELMADDVDVMLQTLGLTEVHLLGHSMGGKTAMTFAAANPDTVMKLIVADIAPRHYPVHHRTILDALTAIHLEKLKSRNEAEEILDRYISDESTKHFLLKNLYRDHRHTFAWRFNLPVINENIEVVGEATYPAEPVQIPTLFIRGVNSDYITDEDIMDIRQYFTNARVETLGNAGHWLHAEQPDAFVGTVMSFLDDTE